jgi:hypothetical protein
MRVTSSAFAAMIAAPLPAWADSSTMDLLSPRMPRSGGRHPRPAEGRHDCRDFGRSIEGRPLCHAPQNASKLSDSSAPSSVDRERHRLSGSFHAATGDKLDAKKAETLLPGGFVSLPARE